MNRAMAYFLWASFCIGLTIMVVFQSAVMFGPNAQLGQIADYMICDIQKLLFNNMLYFAVLIYLGRKNYMDEHVALRCRNQGIELILYMNFHGIVLCAMFLLMLIVGLFASAIITGIEIYVPVSLLVSLTLAGLFAFAWYMIYSAAYTISKNHIVGFFVLLISQLTILVTHFFLQFMCDIDIAKYLLNFVFPIIVIISTEIIQRVVLAKREWY